MLCTPTRTLIALSLSLPLVRSQLVSSLPQCVQDCIDQSQDDNCKVTDIKCLCRASAGNFLPDLITCMHGNCDNALDNDLLLGPLQLACQLAGIPIPASAIRNAENEASSLASQEQVTTTVTVGSEAASTVTLTTTQSGTTIYEIYPITIYGTTTISGPTSTKTVSESMITGPVVIITTNSAGSTYTPRVSNVGTSSSTQTSSVSITSVARSGQSSSSTVGGNSDTTTTTSVAAQETSSSLSRSSGSKTTKGSNPAQTDSAPFTDTNHSGAERARLGMWIGLLAAGFWIWV